jgi:hypothetical protein
MGAIGLNPIRLDRIGLDPIRINAIKLGVPGAASDRPYIDPEVLASLKAVCICYGKSNDDPDRAIIKNLVDPDNPFVISNAAFKLNSGFGKYSADFESFDWTIGISQKQHNKASISLNGRLCNHAAIEVEEMKVNIIGNVTELIYWYIANPDDTARSEIRLTSGINTLPKSYAKEDGQTYNIGFAYISGDNEITIEQIPSFEGAFVTDGIDDLITSTKTVQEMLGGSNEITVVSMVHQVKDTANNVSFTNYIRGSANGYFRNIVNNYGKTGIYGYTSSDLRSLLVINNILGDKNDYTSNGDNRDTIINGNFSVQGYSYNNSNNTGDFSSVAWYWTVIANKGLTTDQINQVIAYFNLDRTLKPDILCDVKKQGITNENHAEFGDKLIDFSGNGRDIQLNNLAWKLDSGIGKYETDLSDTRIWTQSKEITSSPFSFSYNGLSGWILFANTELTNSTDIPSFKIQIKGLLEGQELIYRYYDSNGQSNVYSMGKDGEYTLPSDVRTAKPQTSNTSGFQVVKNEANIITITQIPSHAGALCLDGVNDFGQFVGDLGLKDYTLIMNRAYNNLINNQVPLISSNIVEDQTPFIVEHWDTGSNAISFSYGASRTTDIPLDINKKIVYQSTYSYMGYVIPKGNAISTGGGITLGKFGNGVQYSAICLWSLMLFPYSMSEFLIERQLKKHKLGTLYPDMVEFRPIVKSNLPYSSISYSVNPGEYISVDSMVTITVTLPNTSDKLMEVSCNAISDISISGDNGVYEITGKVVKSPQKINLVISSYLTMLDNETLITNETLIKNE